MLTSHREHIIIFSITCVTWTFVFMRWSGKASFTWGQCSSSSGSTKSACAVAQLWGRAPHVWWEGTGSFWLCWAEWAVYSRLHDPYIETLQSQYMWKNHKRKFVMKMCISTFKSRLLQLVHLIYLVINIWHSTTGKCKLPSSGQMTFSKEQQTQS